MQVLQGLVQVQEQVPVLGFGLALVSTHCLVQHCAPGFGTDLSVVLWQLTHRVLADARMHQDYRHKKPMQVFPTDVFGPVGVSAAHQYRRYRKAHQYFARV